MSKTAKTTKNFLANNTWPLSGNLAQAIIKQLGGEFCFIKDHAKILGMGQGISCQGFLFTGDVLGFFDANKEELLAFAKQAGKPSGVSSIEFIRMNTNDESSRYGRKLTIMEIEKAWFEVAGKNLTGSINRIAVASEIVYSAIRHLCHAYAMFIAAKSQESGLVEH
ncbi:MAG: hypothetical protein J6N72_02260 [Psychrobacter sp.]|nr:hypothetical protein [Psychrobacter sp.]